MTQVKTVERDGYYAVQVGSGVKKVKNVTKPLLGHLQKVPLDHYQTEREQAEEQDEKRRSRREKQKRREEKDAKRKQRSSRSEEHEKRRGSGREAST